MKNIYKRLLTLFLLLLTIGIGNIWGANGDVLFSQDFSSATAVAYTAGTARAYTSSNYNICGTTAASQFTTITCNSKGNCGIGINSTTGGNSRDYSGKFGAYYNNTGGYWSICKTSNFASTAPTAIKIEMNALFSYVSSGSNIGVQFAVGSGFSSGLTNSCPALSACVAGFALPSNSTIRVAKYATSNGNTAINGSSATLTNNTSYKYTWVINNTSSTLTYKGPDGNNTTVAAGCWDLWIGTTRNLAGVTKATTGMSGTTLQNLYIGSFSGKKHEFVLDDITVTDLTPGPACTAPNHVDIGGTWDRFGGDTISLTATAYSSAGTGSPIADANITGWQWQKLIGSTWTNVSNGTTDGVTTSGATTKNLQIANCGQGNSGKYRCVVSTGATCSTASATATDGSEGYGVKVYVLECYTGGTTVYNFTRDGNNQRGSVEIDLAASTGYEFKIHADNYYGNSGTINEDENDWTFTTSGNNVTVNSGLGGTFTFTIDYSSNGDEPVLAVTYPRKTVYLVPNSDWKSNSAKFAFNYFRSGGSAGWTGFLSASTCDGDVYPASIPQWNGVQIIGVRLDGNASSPNWNDKWNQTQDLTLSSSYNKVTITDWNSADYNSNYDISTYTISFAGNGNSGGSMTNVTGIPCDESRTLASNAYAKTGYTFAGWKTNVAVTANGSAVAANGIVADRATISNITSDITLTAQWTAVDYTITHSTPTNGTYTIQVASGSAVSTNTTANYGQTITLAATPSAGYNFTSWSVTGATSGAITVTNNQFTMPAENVTVAATFTAKQTTITLDAQGGNGGTGTLTPTYNQATALVGLPTKTGYSFEGYYTQVSGGGVKLIEPAGSNNQGQYIASVTNYTDANRKWIYAGDNFTLYANWVTATYSVTHTLTNVSRSTGATGAGAATHGTAYSATYTADAGYALPSTISVTAGGSDITSNCTWNASTGALTIPAAYVTGNIVITIVGDDDACFRMVANSSASSDATLTSVASITQGSDNCATLTGGTAQYTFIVPATTKTMTVKKPNSSGKQYGWQFGANSDTIAVTLTGTKLQIGSVISISGYGSSGVGLKCNGVTLVTNGTGSTDNWSGSYVVKNTDTNLVEKYILNFVRATGSNTYIYSISISNCAERPTYNVTYNPNGGSGSSATHNVSNVEDISDLNFTRAGYDFTGWKTGASSGTDYAVGDDVTSALTLYAQWSCVTPTISTDLSTAVHEVEQGDPSVTLTVAATANGTGGNGTVSYQWYKNTSQSTAGATALTTGDTYNAPTTDQGTLYYYCVVTNSSSGCSTTAQSAYATVTVSEPPCFRATITKNSDTYTLAQDEEKNITSDATVTSGGVVKLVNHYAGNKDFNFNDNGVAPGTSDGYIECILPTPNALAEGSTIRIQGKGTEDGAGLMIIDDSGNTIASQTNNGAIDFTCTIPSNSSLIGLNHIRVKRAKASSKNFFKSITVTGCVSCTSRNFTLSYDQTTLLDDEIATPTFTGITTGGTPSYSSSNTSVVTVDSSTGVVTAVGMGTAIVTVSQSASGDYCGGSASVTFTVRALITQPVNVGSSHSWGTPPDMTILHSNITQTAVIANTGYTFDATANGSADRGGMTAKFMGVMTASTPYDNMYLSMQVTATNARVKLNEVLVPLQPVSKPAGMKVTISDAAGNSVNGTLTSVAAGAINKDIITFNNAPWMTGLITIKIQVYNQEGSSTTTNGFRLGTPILVDGEVQTVYTFISDGAWTTASNWSSNTVPGASDNVIIDAAATISTTGNQCKDMEFTSNGSLEIANTGMLKVNGTLTNTDASKLTVNIPGGIAIGSGMGSVRATVNFACSAGQATIGNASHYRWQAIGWPFTALADVHDPFGQSWIMEYFGNNAWDYVRNGNGLTPFQGYLLTPKAAQNSRSYTWTGTLNGDAAKALSLDYYGNASDHWNFVANSWLAPIDAATLTSDYFTNADATVYLLNTGSRYDSSNTEYVPGTTDYGDTNYDDAGQYTVVNSTLASAEHILIAPGQGFFVAANNSSGGTLNLNYADHVFATAASTTRGSNVMRAPRREQQAPDFTHMKITVRGERFGDGMYIFEGDRFTGEYDNGADGQKAMGMFETSPQIMAQAEYGDMSLYATPDVDGTLIGFRAGTADTQYTLRFSGNMGQMYLTDLVTNTETLVGDGSEYTFTAENTDEVMTRFRLNRSTQHGGTTTDIEDGTDGGVKVLVRDGEVELVWNNEQGAKNKDIRLYDATGKLLYEEQGTRNKEQGASGVTLRFTLPQQGVYLLRIGTTTRKIVY